MLKLLRMGYFYLAVILTALLVLPIFLVRPFNPKNTSLFLRVFAKLTLWSTGLEYEEIDPHILEENRPSILVGNHQHNMDTLMVSLALSRHVIFLGKKEILRVPFLGICFYLGGNVFIDRGNRRKALKSLQVVRQKLEEKGLCVVIFPEGTRNGGEELLPFKRGAFITAIQTQLPVIPFAVSQYARTMDLSKKDSGKIAVKFLDPIPTKGMTMGDAPALAKMSRDAIEKAIKEMVQS